MDLVIIVKGTDKGTEEIDIEHLCINKQSHVVYGFLNFVAKVLKIVACHEVSAIFIFY